MASILVVDDSPTQAMNLSKILEKYGHSIITAEDGASGVASAKEHKPDLVLMDVVMPGLNGFQATRKLTKDSETAHIPVILVTTKDQETDRVWGERQGAKDYLVKPVEETALMATVDRCLAGDF